MTYFIVDLKTLEVPSLCHEKYLQDMNSQWIMDSK